MKHRVSIGFAVVLSVLLMWARPAFGQAVGTLPGSAPPGTEITVFGDGFQPFEVITIFFGGIEVVTEADGEGSFTAQLTIDPLMPPGMHPMEISGDQGSYIDFEYEVTEPPPPTTEATTTTTAATTTTTSATTTTVEDTTTTSSAETTTTENTTTPATTGSSTTLVDDTRVAISEGGFSWKLLLGTLLLLALLYWLAVYLFGWRTPPWVRRDRRDSYGDRVDQELGDANDGDDGDNRDTQRDTNGDEDTGTDTTTDTTNATYEDDADEEDREEERDTKPDCTQLRAECERLKVEAAEAESDAQRALASAKSAEAACDRARKKAADAEARLGDLMGRADADQLYQRIAEAQIRLREAQAEMTTICDEVGPARSEAETAASRAAEARAAADVACKTAEDCEAAAGN